MKCSIGDFRLSFIKKTLCIEPKRGIKKFSIVSKPVFLTKAFIFERIVDISVLELFELL